MMDFFGAGRGARAMAKAVGAASETKKRVVVFGDAVAKAVEESGHEPVRAAPESGRLALDDASVDALCASGLPDREITTEVLKECARVVKPSGRVILATANGLVGRGPERHVLTALFLHAGLVDIEQRLSRGTAITLGKVSGFVAKAR
jgi:ubiquinone/menaquinone biosynthesis C-methylase UbiE